MDKKEIDPQRLSEEIEKNMGTIFKGLRFINLGFQLSVTVFIIIGFILMNFANGAAQKLVDDTIVWVLVGFGVLLFFFAGTISKTVAKEIDKATDIAQVMKAFLGSFLVGQAIREGAGIIGLVLTFLTGEFYWVLGFGVACIYLLQQNRPNKTELRNILQRKGIGVDINMGN